MFQVVHAAKLRVFRPENIDAWLAQAFQENGLGNRHLTVIMTLAMAGPMSVSVLADRISLAPSTTSLLVNELARAGLVERDEDEKDHRRRIVHLPDARFRELESLARERLKPIKRTLERLGPAEREQFMNGLRVLAEELGRESVSSDDETQVG